MELQSRAQIRQLCLQGELHESADRLAEAGHDVASICALLREPDAVPRPPGSTTVRLTRHGGESTEMHVHVPASSGTLGALLFLHGAGSDGGRVAEIAQGLGDASGSVVLCPTAIASPSPTSNFDLGGLLGRSVRHPRWHHGEDDFPMLALRWAKRHLDVDPNRCAVAGHSMGAVSTWNLAARFWSALAGAAPINGALSVWERFGPDEEADALRPNLLNLPIFAIHGTDDTRIPLELEAGTVTALRQCGHERIVQVPVPGGDHPLGTMRMGPGSPHYDGLARWLASLRRPAWPTQVRHRTFDAPHARAHWVEMAGLRRPHAPAELQACVTDRRTVEVSARGADALRLHLHRQIVDAGDLRIVVNGVVHRHCFEPCLVSFIESYRQTLDAWSAAEDSVSIRVTDTRLPTRHGECIDPTH